MRRHARWGACVWGVCLGCKCLWACMSLGGYMWGWGACVSAGVCGGVFGRGPVGVERRVSWGPLWGACVSGEDVCVGGVSGGMCIWGACVGKVCVWGSVGGRECLRRHASAGASPWGSGGTQSLVLASPLERVLRLLGEQGFRSHRCRAPGARACCCRCRAVIGSVLRV